MPAQENNTSANTAAIAVNPLVTTTYTVFAVTVTGCTAAASVTQPVSATCITGINKQSLNRSARIFPTPTKNRLSVELTGGLAGDAVLLITDAQENI